MVDTIESNNSLFIHGKHFVIPSSSDINAFREYYDNTLGFRAYWGNIQKEIPNDDALGCAFLAEGVKSYTSDVDCKSCEVFSRQLSKYQNQCSPSLLSPEMFQDCIVPPLQKAISQFLKSDFRVSNYQFYSQRKGYTFEKGPTGFLQLFLILNEEAEISWFDPSTSSLLQSELLAMLAGAEQNPQKSAELIGLVCSTPLKRGDIVLCQTTSVLKRFSAMECEEPFQAIEISLVPSNSDWKEAFNQYPPDNYALDFEWLSRKIKQEKIHAEIHAALNHQKRPATPRAITLDFQLSTNEIKSVQHHLQKNLGDVMLKMPALREFLIKKSVGKLSPSDLRCDESIVENLSDVNLSEQIEEIKSASLRADRSDIVEVLRVLRCIKQGIMNKKVLVVGAKTMREVYQLLAIGFNANNIWAINEFSGCKSIEVALPNYIPFEDKCFDIVIYIDDSFQLIEKENTVALELVRVAKQDSILVVSLEGDVENVDQFENQHCIKKTLGNQFDLLYYYDYGDVSQGQYFLDFIVNLI